MKEFRTGSSTNINAGLKNKEIYYIEIQYDLVGPCVIMSVCYIFRISNLHPCFMCTKVCNGLLRPDGSNRRVQETCFRGPRFLEVELLYASLFPSCLYRWNGETVKRGKKLRGEIKK